MLRSWGPNSVVSVYGIWYILLVQRPVVWYWIQGHWNGFRSFWSKCYGLRSLMDKIPRIRWMFCCTSIKCLMMLEVQAYLIYICEFCVNLIFRIWICMLKQKKIVGLLSHLSNKFWYCLSLLSNKSILLWFDTHGAVCIYANILLCRKTGGKMFVNTSITCIQGYFKSDILSRIVISLL